MRFYTTPPKFYGGIALHARPMYVWSLHGDGAILVHRDLTAAPKPFLRAMAPYREHRVVCVDCLVTWGLSRATRPAHLHHTHSQHHLPQLGRQLASQANREGVAERFPDPAVQEHIAGDLTPIGPDDRLLTALAPEIVHTAKAHEAQTFSRLRSTPGVGTTIARVPRPRYP